MQVKHAQFGQTRKKVFANMGFAAGCFHQAPFEMR
jgi:hypothetical protein